eukprot:gene40328-49143_t
MQLIFLNCACSLGNEPFSTKLVFQQGLKNIVRRILASSVVVQTVSPIPVRATISSLQGLYTDNEAKFALLVPPSFVVNAKKVIKRIIPSAYGEEDVLFSATSPAEGASIGVTRSDARRLLKDFDVEWWFADLNSLEDLGTAELTATLLILQRQGAFSSKETKSRIVSSQFISEASQLEGKNSKYLLFDFLTPIVDGVDRRTLAKAYLDQGSLYVIWLSSLESVMDGEYATTLQDIRKSFFLL